MSTCSALLGLALSLRRLQDKNVILYSFFTADSTQKVTHFQVVTSYHPSNVYFMETFSGSVYRWGWQKGKTSKRTASMHVAARSDQQTIKSSCYCVAAAAAVIVRDQHTQTKATNQFFQKKRRVSFCLIDPRVVGAFTCRVLECFKWFCLCGARWSRFLFQLEIGLTLTS